VGITTIYLLAKNEKGIQSSAIPRGPRESGTLGDDYKDSKSKKDEG